MLQFYLGKTKFLPAHVYDTLVDVQVVLTLLQHLHALGKY